MTFASLTTPEAVSVSLTIKGAHHALMLDPRTTLLDLLREHLDLTGTKKGCDQGQCGHGHFGFNRLGGVGECTSQYQPEPLPRECLRAVRSWSRTGSPWQSVCTGYRRHAWLWHYEGLPSPKGCRQHAGAVSSCSRDPS